jgi:hypothetical protein
MRRMNEPKKSSACSARTGSHDGVPRWTLQAHKRLRHLWVLGGDPNTARPDVLAEKNDDDPNSVIGGGELNLAAGMMLYDELNPQAIVFAYGDNSPALAAKGFPSESSVVSQIFVEKIKERWDETPNVIVFDSDDWKTEGKASGTFNEIRNILRLATRENVDEVVIVTILLHMTRAAGMLEQHLRDPGFTALRKKVRFEVTETVLLRTDPDNYAERIWEIFGSQSYLRNLQREANGLVALRKGTTQTNKPGVVLTGTK